MAVSDFLLGLIGCIISSVFFGTQFVPLKPFHCGDGIFVQWVQAVAIFLVGLVVFAIQNFPKFYPLAMLGGCLFATGNVVAVPIINEIGLALALLLWGFSNLVTGWVTGRFGLLGLKPQVPESDVLNGMGLALSLLSTVVFVFVGTESNQNSNIDNAHDDSTILSSAEGASENPELSTEDATPIIGATTDEDDRTTFPVEHVPTGTPFVSPARVIFRNFSHSRKILGCFAALLVGVFFGLCFTPVIYIQNNTKGASQNGLDYVFAHYTGILGTATVYFVIYCCHKRNEPFVNPKSVLPGLTAGVLWAVAFTAWFVANDKLSEAVSFPIVTRFPGVVAAIWGVFVFREIRGRRNLVILSVAILVTVIGGVLSGLSKIVKWG